MDKYDAYLYDMDGTLARTLDVWIDACQAAYVYYGIQVSRDETATRLGTVPGMLAGIAVENHEEAWKRITEYSHPRVKTAPLYDGAVAGINRARADQKKTALITATSRDIVTEILAYHNLLSHFDVIITGDEVKANKPDPEGILRAIAALSIEPSKAIMLGDSDKDLGAAQNAGIDSALYYPEAHSLIHDLTHLKTFNPTYTIAHWDDFLPRSI